MASSFYHDNLFRSYPFCAEQEANTLPTGFLAAARICVSYGHDAMAFPRIGLTGIAKVTGMLRLSFLVRAGLAETTFPVDIPDSYDQFQKILFETDTLQGSLTLGRASADISVPLSTFSPCLWLEPTTTIWLKSRGISRIVFGNRSRHRLTPIDYDGLTSQQKTAYEDPDIIWQQEQTVTSGELLIAAGFNGWCTTIPSTGTLTLTPQRNAGYGPVSEVISAGTYNTMEEFDPGKMETKRADGLPIKEHLLYSFSGATGENIQMEESRMISVRPGSDASTIHIGLKDPREKTC